MAWYDRLATWMFFIYLVAAVPILLFVFGSGYWFEWDEWVVLSGRTFTFHDLMAQYNGHWCAIPFAAMLMVFHVVGLNSYRPYQLIAILSHVAICALLWLVIRRTGVRPWIAALVAGLFVLFGPGSSNTQVAFQITFTWPVLFGLAQLLLVDHSEPTLDRRDVFALLFGFAALMSSGVAVAMIFGVSLTVLLRRGWRPAAFQAVPLGATYSIWYVLASPSRLGAVDGGLFHRAHVLVNWSLSALGSVPNALVPGHHIVGQVLSWMFIAIIATGVVLTARAYGTAAFRGKRSVVWGLAASCLLFILIVAVGRGKLPRIFGVHSRYIYLYVLFVLPLVAVALDTLSERARSLMVVGLVLMAAAVPGSLHAYRTPQRFASHHDQGVRWAILGSAASPLAATAPSDLVPANVATLGPPFGPSIGWLSEQRAAGRIPDPGPLSPARRAEIELTLALVAVPGPPVSTRCKGGRGIFQVRVSPADGEVLTLLTEGSGGSGEFTIGLLDAAGQTQASTTMSKSEAQHLLVNGAGHRFSIGYSVPTAHFRVCRS